MINRNLNRGRNPLEIKIHNFTRNGGESWRTCKFCSGNSRYHPEGQIQDTDGSWICSWHYLWRYRHELEHESPLNLEETYDDR